MTGPWQLCPPQPLLVTFWQHEFLIWCALIDSAPPGTVRLPSCLLTPPPTPSYPPCIYISIYPCISLTLRLSNITRLDRLRWMDGSRKSSQWCYPPCDLAHDTMSPKCQTWRRIKCFKVSQAQIKPNRPLGWWTSFFSRKKASSCGRHDTWALEHRHNICHVAY